MVLPQEKAFIKSLSERYTVQASKVKIGSFQESTKDTCFPGKAFIKSTKDTCFQEKLLSKVQKLSACRKLLLIADLMR